MRVLMTADTVGGVFSYAVELTRALQARGVEVVLATLGRRLSTHQREELRRLQPIEVHESAWRLEWMPDPWSDVDACGEWLGEVVERTAPDCIHFNHFAHAALAWPVPALVVGHSCVWSWWQAVHGSAPPSAEYARYHERVRAGLQRADRVIAPSLTMLCSLIECYGAFAYGGVIPNGIDPAPFAPRRKRDFVLAAGRLWDQGKNVGALERVAPQLAWPIYVAGEARAPDGIGPRRAADARVRPLGPLSRSALAHCLSRAGIYALPARYEPFGLSVLEAASAGCALVLGRIPSLLENWEGAALFVDPDDSAELARALQRLIDDPLALRRAGAAARERSRAFGAARMAEAYLYAYREAREARTVRGLSCAS